MTRVPYQSQAADFADTSMEAVCYYAYYAATELVEERGGYLEQALSSSIDWDAAARTHQAVRHSQLELRGDPDATISNIIGVSACIERRASGVM